MSKFDLDFSNYTNRFGDNVVPGRYRCKVVEIEPTKSQSGNNMLNVRMSVLSVAPGAKGDGSAKGATLVNRLTLTENAIFKAWEFVRACGMNPERKKYRFDSDQFIGKVVDVEVDDREWNGNISTNVLGVYPPAMATQSDDSGNEDEFDSAEDDAAVSDTDELVSVSKDLGDDDDVDDSPATEQSPKKRPAEEQVELLNLDDIEL